MYRELRCTWHVYPLYQLFVDLPQFDHTLGYTGIPRDQPRSKSLRALEMPLPCRPVPLRIVKQARARKRSLLQPEAVCKVAHDPKPSAFGLPIAAHVAGFAPLQSQPNMEPACIASTCA